MKTKLVCYLLLDHRPSNGYFSQLNGLSLGYFFVWVSSVPDEAYLSHGAAVI